MSKGLIGNLLQIFKASVSSVLPENLVKRSLRYNAVTEELLILTDKYNLRNKNLYLVGFGKAVQSMAIEVEALLKTKIKEGVVSIPFNSLNDTTVSERIKYLEGADNNLPDDYAEDTARYINDLVTQLDENDFLLVLISGGGSALLPFPKQQITLEEKCDLIKKLANSGADITELNSVRKQLSDLKGGKLAIKAQPCMVASLVLSDIVGDPLDLIASGPTMENTDQPSKSKDILTKYKLYDNLTDSIKLAIAEEVDTEFPKNNVKNYIIGSNKISLEAAVNEAKSLNYMPIKISNTITGNVTNVAEDYTNITKIFCRYLDGSIRFDNLKTELKTIRIPGANFDDIDTVKNKDINQLCLVFGGETTVEVRGKGLGGRNQQLALEFAKQASKIKESLDNFDVYFLSAGTDGIDGPTDAAGAISYTDLFEDAKKENIDVLKYLKENDSYNFYKSFNNGHFHVITGHTNTNVMDVHLIIIRQK